MNTDRSLLFMILALASIWLVIDEFYGAGRIGQLAAKLTPNLPTPGDVIGGVIEDTKDKVVDKVDEAVGKVTEPVKEKAEEVKDTAKENWLRDGKEFDQWADDIFYSPTNPGDKKKDEVVKEKTKSLREKFNELLQGGRTQA